VSSRRSSLLVPFLLFSLPSIADAEDPRDGSIPATTCVRTRATIVAGKAIADNGGYIFGAGETGTLDFSCRLTFLTPGSPLASHMSVQAHYRNDDDASSEADYYVSLEVIRRSKANGTTTQICQVYSDGSGVDSTPFSGCYFDITNEESYYFVANVRVYRRIATQPSSIRWNGITYTLSE
jgi:hypothetical protein